MPRTVLGLSDDSATVSDICKLFLGSARVHLRASGRWSWLKCPSTGHVARLRADHLRHPRVRWPFRRALPSSGHPLRPLHPPNPSLHIPQEHPLCSSPGSQCGELPRPNEASALVANMKSSLVSCEKRDLGRKAATIEGRPGSSFSADVFLDAQGVSLRCFPAGEVLADSRDHDRITAGTHGGRGREPIWEIPDHAPRGDTDPAKGDQT